MRHPRNDSVTGPAATTVAPDLAALRRSLEERLGELLPAETIAPQNLSRAIRYAALAPGKRLRGLLVVLAAGSRAERALDAACAVEMVHAASLVVDDLPCMDDAVMRRGQPALHRVYGEATASLAALALLNLAYGVLAGDPGLPAALRAELAVLLSRAVGLEGLVGGQEQDLHEDYPAGDVAGLSDMYERKTGVLFVAAAAIGGRIAGLPPAGEAALRRFARSAGLAYQVADDLADIAAAPGGAAGAPDADDANLVSAVGREQAERLVATLLEDARAGLAALGPHGAPLAALVACMFDGRGTGATAGSLRRASG